MTPGTSNFPTFENAEQFGALASRARSLRQPENLCDLSSGGVEYFFFVQEDVIQRHLQIRGKFLSRSSIPETGVLSRNWLVQPVLAVIPTRLEKALRKFVRQNVREFRRSRDRLSGVRSVVLLPVVAVLYLSGLHRIISIAVGSRTGGGNK